MLYPVILDEKITQFGEDTPIRMILKSEDLPENSILDGYVESIMYRYIY